MESQQNDDHDAREEEDSLEEMSEDGELVESVPGPSKKPRMDAEKVDTAAVASSSSSGDEGDEDDEEAEEEEGEGEDRVVAREDRDREIEEMLGMEPPKKKSAKKRKGKKKAKAANLRRNIKSMLKGNQLDSSTKEAQAEEQERLHRLQVQDQRRQQFRQQLLAKLNRNQEILQAGPPQLLPQQQHPPPRLMQLAGIVPSPETMQQRRRRLPPPLIRCQQMPSVIEISSSDDDEESAAAATRPKVETDMNAADYSKTAAASDSDSDIQILSGDDQDLALDDDDEDDDPNDVGSHVDDSLNVADLEGRVLVNVGHPDNEDPIYLPPQLARVMKPHQIGGVRFLYDNVVESSERYRESQGFGCILGHSMGLGKTIQVCTFSDVFLTSTPGRHVLIIVPINTLQNWLSEFNHWLPEDPAATLLAKTGPVRPRDFGVYLLNDSVRNLPQRSRVIETWQREGGVLLMGYELYRQMAMRKQRKKRVAAKKKNGPVCIDIEEEDRDKDMLDDVYRALVDPGPDLIICDEGHRIKNALASTSKALKSIGTKRRVVLTGYPLQNNLMEYWCMVDFVRPNFLGTQSEFSNLFERPIANGQCVDSTPRDKRVMMHRAHVLTGLLKGFVQRRGQKVLESSLPPKYEHVFLLRLMPVQRRLYTRFIDDLRDGGSVGNPLRAFAVCCKIWNHPDVLHTFLKKKEAALDLEDDLLAPNGTRPKTKKVLPPLEPIMEPHMHMPGFINEGPGFNPFAPSSSKKEEISYDWAKPLMQEYVPEILEHSSKFQIFFSILDETIRAGDRLLLFSQSLLALNLIEDFLQNGMTLRDGVTSWANGINYFRLDGSTPAMERERLINAFNASKDPAKIPLFMVSTRAGSLGINLVGANRVVVLDASWNPCHDSQAVCRVYRYGQKKPCHIYRLVTDNTVEKRIYDRQVNKQGMADRVVDEQNPDNHLHSKDMNGLIGENETDPEGTFDPSDVDRAVQSCSQDPVLQNILQRLSALFTKLPFTHESQLVDRKEKRLSKAEKRLAERSFQLERSGKAAPQASYSPPLRSAVPGYVSSGLGARLPNENGFGGHVPPDWTRHGGFFSGGSVFNAPPSFPPPPGGASVFPPNHFFPPSLAQPGPSTRPDHDGVPLPALTELERLLQTGPKPYPSQEPYMFNGNQSAHGSSPPTPWNQPNNNSPPSWTPIVPSNDNYFSTESHNWPPADEPNGILPSVPPPAAGQQLLSGGARKDMAIKELCVPRDMEIPTSNPDQPPVRLSKGQRVMVLKTSKGVYLKMGEKVIKIKLPQELLMKTTTSPSPLSATATSIATTHKNDEIVIESSDDEDHEQKRSETYNNDAAAEADGAPEHQQAEHHNDVEV